MGIAVNGLQILVACVYDSSLCLSTEQNYKEMLTAHIA